MNFEQADLSIEKLKKIEILSRKARAAILKMTTLAGCGHPGGSMSSIDFLLTLYHMIDFNVKDPKWIKRDKVIFSCGHIAPAAYSTLGLLGFFPLDNAISQFRLAGSIFEGHVEPDVPGIEWASGNLGQGLSAGCGFALASRIKKIDDQIFVLMGDGEQQKGQLSEARRFAAKYELKNLTAFVDYNKLQISGSIQKVMPQNIRANYESDGWKVIEIDGHDLLQIRDTILQAVKNEFPTLILAHTNMGKGVSFMEDNEKYHGAALKREQLELALRELNEPQDLKKYEKLREDFQIVANEEKSLFQPELKIPEPQIYTEKTDNRSAWGKAIANIADLNQDKMLAVFDCDLQGSVKTKDFEKIIPDKFFQSGIMEHNTAVVSGALSKCGIQTFFVDFGVFGVDETYNQHRLNDINQTNLKIVTTHVGLDVGEDGKTHQCIDYLGVMKNLFGFKILIPADPNQTDHIVRYVADKPGNFLIAMGRSKLAIIKKEEKVFFDENYNFQYGKADLLHEGNSAALFVMGTFAGRAVEIAKKLETESISLQVWNISTPKELDESALISAAETGVIFTYEDHNVETGLGNSLADKLMRMGLSCKFHKFGVKKYACSGENEDIIKKNRLDVESVSAKILSFINK